MLLFLTLCVIALTTFYCYLSCKLNYWKSRDVPHIKPSFFTGNFNGVGTYLHFVEKINKVYDKFKFGNKFCGFYLLQDPRLLILDLDLVKSILIKDFNYFEDRGIYHNEKDDPLSAHLFAIDGVKWKSLRQKVTTIFTSSKIKMMFPIIAGFSNDLVKLVDEMSKINDGIDIKQICVRYTADVIGACGYNLDCNALKDERAEILQFQSFFDLEGITRTLMIFANTFPNFSKLIGLKVIPKSLTQFFMNLIKDTCEFRKTNDIQQNDFLNLIMEDNANNIEMATQSFMFIIAGFETSSTTMNYAFYELAYRQTIQDKLRDEINQVLSQHNNELTCDALMEMSYLDQIVHETLRLYSPVDKLIRKCVKDYKVQDTNFIIEKGTNIFIPVYSIHHDSRFYYDPMVFDPERFNPEQKRNRSNMTFLPFGDGPRNCIGSRFALMQTKFGIATLIKNFKFKLNKQTSYPLVLNPQHLLMNPIKSILLDTERVIQMTSI